MKKESLSQVTLFWYSFVWVVVVFADRAQRGAVASPSAVRPYSSHDNVVLLIKNIMLWAFGTTRSGTSRCARETEERQGHV
jgi:hypothetical protein